MNIVIATKSIFIGVAALAVSVSNNVYAQSSSVDTYKSILQEISDLKLSTAQKEIYLKTQNEKITNLQDQIEGIPATTVTVGPLLDKMAAAIESEIYDELKKGVEEQYVQINDVLVRDVTLPNTIKQAIERKLSQEQMSLEYEFKLEKATKEAQRIEIDAKGKARANEILDASLLSINEHARVVLCGLISEYNTEHKGAKNLWQLIVKQAVIRGFLIRDYAPRFAEGGIEMAKWITDGKINFDEHIEKGIENTFDAFMLLFSGGNNGKLILDIRP